MKNNTYPPVSSVRNAVDYDKETGFLRWKKRKDRTKSWNKRFAGKIVWNKYSNNYLFIVIDGKSCPAHRAAWAIVTGEWPKNQIDHIDRNGMNNKWRNLREATPQQNQGNKGIQRNNSSGIRGVTFHSRYKKWQAQIKIRGKIKHLGVFLSKEEASVAYKKASFLHFGEFSNV